VTGGAQTWVDTNFPGAFYKDAGVEYVCVCGKAVEGVKRDAWKREKPTPQSYAYNSYKEVRLRTAMHGTKLQRAVSNSIGCMLYAHLMRSLR
jgi:hypothetical protein